MGSRSARDRAVRLLQAGWIRPLILQPGLAALLFGVGAGAEYRGGLCPAHARLGPTGDRRECQQHVARSENDLRPIGVHL